MEIKQDGKLYAVLYQADLKNEMVNDKTVWIGQSDQPLQASCMYYNNNKVFKTHRHILNPRLINRTQEAFIVIKGLLRVDIYLDKETLLGSLVASQGDIITVYSGFHKISILEDKTIAYEIKCGQFTTISDDKEFLE